MTALATAMRASHAREFLERGHSLVPFAPRPGLIEGVIDGWKKFLAVVPREERLRWEVKMPHHSETDDGYLNRRSGAVRPQGGAYDDKEVLHFRSYLPAVLTKLGINIEPWADWLELLRELHAFCRGTVFTFTEEMDREEPGYRFADAVRHPDADLNHVIRLLMYDPVKYPGQELAKKHPDRDGITLHVAESHPGLVLHKGNTSALYVPEKERALAFPGKHFAGATGFQMNPLIHSVISPPELGTPADLRWAIIFFAHTVS